MYRNSFIYITVSVISVLSNFAVLPFFTRYLSLADYGVVALFILYGSLSSNLLSFGLGQALTKFYFKYSYSKYKIIFSSIYFVLIAIFSLLVILVVIYEESINKYILNNVEENKLIVLSIFNGCILFLYIINKELIINQKKPLIHSFLVLLQLTLNLSISFYLVFFKDLTYLGLIYGLTLANVITLLSSLLFIRRYLVLDISFMRIKEALYFSYPETPNTLIGLAFKSFDKVMLANIKGNQSVGAYDLGQRFASLIKIIQDSIAYVWSPLFMEMAESKSSEALKKLKIFFNEIIILLGFIALGVSFFAEEVLILLTNPEFYSIKYLIPLLAITAYAQVLSYIYTNQILFAGKLIYNLPISILSLSLNIGLNIIMIPIYGVIGAILATMIAKIFNIGISLYFGNVAYPIKIGLRKILIKIIFISLIILTIYPLMYFVDSLLISFLIKFFIIIFLFIAAITFKFIDLFKIYNDFFTDIRGDKIDEVQRLR